MSEGVKTMTPEETEALAHRWHMDLFQAGRLEVADEILADDFVAHVNSQDMRGAEGAKQLASAIRTAFPDVQITHQEALVSGDRVAIRWTSDATHRGDYFGVPPTEKRIRIEGLDLVHLRDGKIAELWISYDNLGVLQQMGAVPQPQQAGA
jgi:steroid delta-isomerase-like uncharacterized protein